MALGEFKMFQFKSKKQREKEEREYAAWAFPYGDLQKERLIALICELIPKTSAPLCLAAFLTCKELFENMMENTESREDAAKNLVVNMGSYSQLIKKNEMPTYVAIVLADAEIDEKCEYPSVDEMRTRIQKLTELREENKKPGFFKRKKSTDET